MKNYIDTLKKRRTIYALGNNTKLSEDKIENLVKEAIKESPSAFNSQSSRAVILFGKSNQKLWQIVKDELQKIVPEEAFADTEAKINSFAAGSGTVLFFEDQRIIHELENDYPTYKANFAPWSEQSTAMAQQSVWIALAEEGIGASIQHYSPIIDEAVTEAFGLDHDWKLKAQMPFGSIEAPAGEKLYIDDEQRFKTFI